VHSVGSAGQLRLLERYAGGRKLEAIAVPERIVDAPTMARLAALAGDVLAWPVDDPDRARALLALGVRGLISDRPDRILPCLATSGAPA